MPSLLGTQSTIPLLRVDSKFARRIRNWKLLTAWGASQHDSWWRRSHFLLDKLNCLSKSSESQYRLSPPGVPGGSWPWATELAIGGGNEEASPAPAPYIFRQCSNDTKNAFLLPRRTCFLPNGADVVWESVEPLVSSHRSYMESLPISFVFIMKACVPPGKFSKVHITYLPLCFVYGLLLITV